MKHSNFIDRESRRDALKSMAVLGSAAVVSAATTGASAADATTQEVKSDVPSSLGYRETDHIREYYRRARF